MDARYKINEMINYDMDDNTINDKMVDNFLECEG